MLLNLGANVVIDYKQDDADAKIISEGPYVILYLKYILFRCAIILNITFVNRYDIILDCANQGPEYVKMKGYPHNTYIALNSPLLKNIDQHGLVVGMIKNVENLLKLNIPGTENKSNVKWGFFIPSQIGINVLQNFVENKKACINI